MSIFELYTNKAGWEAAEQAGLVILDKLIADVKKEHGGKVPRLHTSHDYGDLLVASEVKCFATFRKRVAQWSALWSKLGASDTASREMMFMHAIRKLKEAAHGAPT